MDKPVIESLVRMETIQQTMLKQINKIDERIEKIETRIANAPCKEHEFKINLTKRIVFGAVIIILLAFMSSITSGVKLL